MRRRHNPTPPLRFNVLLFCCFYSCVQVSICLWRIVKIERERERELKADKKLFNATPISKKLLDNFNKDATQRAEKLFEIVSSTTESIPTYLSSEGFESKGYGQRVGREPSDHKQIQRERETRHQSSFVGCCS